MENLIDTTIQVLKEEIESSSKQLEIEKSDAKIRQEKIQLEIDGNKLLLSKYEQLKPMFEKLLFDNANFSELTKILRGLGLESRIVFFENEL